VDSQATNVVLKEKHDRYGDHDAARHNPGVPIRSFKDRKLQYAWNDGV